MIKNDSTECIEVKKITHKIQHLNFEIPGTTVPVLDNFLSLFHIKMGHEPDVGYSSDNLHLNNYFDVLCPKDSSLPFLSGTNIVNNSLTDLFFTCRAGGLPSLLSPSSRKINDTVTGSGSIVDPDPYLIRIQELSGSGSIFEIRIRIHTNRE